VVLAAPGQGLTISAAAGPEQLLPALAAAVIAKFENLPRAFLAAVGLGLITQVVAFNVHQESVTDVVLVGIILVALLLQRQAGRAGEGGESWTATQVLKPIPAAMRRLPEVIVGRIGLYLVVAGVIVAVPLVAGPGTTLTYTVAFTFGIVALSLLVLSGWSGNISLGQFAFGGVGGVIAGDLIQKANLDLFFSLAAAGAAGAVLALLVGLPALRIRGEYLVVVTLALAVAVNEFFLNPTNFPTWIPGGFFRPVLWKRIDLGSERAWYFFCLAILILVALFVAGLRRARAGRVLLANRDNTRAAAAMSVPPVRVQLTGFVLAGVIAGIGGALYAITLRSVGYETFNEELSLIVFAMAVLGGLGSMWSVLFGVTALSISANFFPQFQDLIAGFGLTLTVLINPGGIGYGLLQTRDQLLTLVARRRGMIVPSLNADRRDATLTDRPPDEENLLAGALTGEAADGPATNGAQARFDEDWRKDTTPPQGTPAVPAASANGEWATISAPGPATNGASIALDCTKVEMSYGPVQVLFGVDLQVHEGEIVALLGTNGAGKSTLLRGVSGLNKVGGGNVVFRGSSIAGKSAQEVVTMGISLMPGGRGVFPTLSVDENLRLGAWLVRKDKKATDEASQRVHTLFPILKQRHSQQAGNLSGGEQQMLSLAMALMVTPRILMIDELSLGLAPTVIAQLLDVVRLLHESGTTIIVVEQSVNVALELAERAVFLEKGEVRFSGPTADLLARPDILRSVFIEGASAIVKNEPHHTAKPAELTIERVAPSEEAPVVLACRGVTKHFGGIAAVQGVDLELRQGEILGLIGHNGAGKTTLFDMISGFLPLDGGRVLLGGADIGLWPAYMRAAAGLGRTFQEARLFPSLTVEDTIAVSLERHLASRDLIAAGLRLPASTDSEAEVAEKVDELVQMMGLNAYAEKLVGELSTGTRRIVELACVLAQDPAVLLLDEPSGGVAQRETEAMGPLLLRVQQHSGCSILVVEHDMPLLSTICDRMIALELGEVIASGTPDEVLEHPRVVESYLGTNEATINRSDVGVRQ
jgi:ABC-type branched-subunit amino acid transport system ATPase component/ABC-type branched-subunit amino acid transport system permease subunit